MVRTDRSLDRQQDGRCDKVTRRLQQPDGISRGARSGAPLRGLKLTTSVGNHVVDTRALCYFASCGSSNDGFTLLREGDN